jgi:nicotinamide-nucleotide amidase
MTSDREAPRRVDMIPDDSALRALAERVGAVMQTRGLRIVVAESCTGGWIAKALTDVPGSSRWFDGGFVVYADTAKRRLLDAPAAMLATHGAVSEPVVRALAAAARERLGADYAVAVSGVAGPGGGTPEKPVGLVWFAWAAGAATTAESRRFAGDREAVRRQSVAFALERLLDLAAGERNGA